MSTPTRKSNHFTNRTDAVEEVYPETWYRSPLWGDDHLLGIPRDWAIDRLAWCGRPLGAAIEMGTDSELGGLWESDRKSGKCSECTRRQKEWDERDKGR